MLYGPISAESEITKEKCARERSENAPTTNISDKPISTSKRDYT